MYECSNCGATSPENCVCTEIAEIIAIETECKSIIEDMDAYRTRLNDIGEAKKVAIQSIASKRSN